MAGQGNGNGKGGPPVGSGSALPFWKITGNSISATDFIGTTNNFPLLVKVNNGLRASFTNNGMEIIGNTHTSSATIDSIAIAWKIFVNEALKTKIINAEQYFQNDTLVDLLGIQSSVGVLQFDVSNLQSSVAGQQTEIDTLQNEMISAQSSITIHESEIDTLQTSFNNLQSTIVSSQWHNNDTNIYFNSGFVGIGTSEPSELLEINGRIKITGSPIAPDTTGNPSPPPAPGQSKSIIIDGGIDRITATSGTLDFDNTNLTTNGNIQSASITTSNLTITDKLESDSMHARKSLEINNSLKLVRDTTEMYAEVSTKDTAVALMLQKEPSAEVVIGDAAPPASGEARSKLTVVGNTKLDGNTSVLGDFKVESLSGISTRTVIVDSNGVFRQGPPPPDSFTPSVPWQTRGNDNMDAPTGSPNFVDFIGTLNAADFVMTTNYSEKMRISVDGRIGIGTPNPQEKLHILGTDAKLRVGDNSNFINMGFDGANQIIDANGNGTLLINFYSGKPVTFGAPSGMGGGNIPVKIFGNLEVCDKITVLTDSWCDFVFDKDYIRMSFEEKEQFYTKNKHLYKIPPESEIIKNGMNLEEILNGITYNVEDLSLNQIDMYKTLLKQQQKINELEEQIKLLKK